MPGESKNNANKRESGDQSGAGSSTQTLAREFNRAVHLDTPSSESDVPSPTPVTPTTPAVPQTPRPRLRPSNSSSSCSSNSSSSSSNSSSSSSSSSPSSSSPPFRRALVPKVPPPPPAVGEHKHEFTTSNAFVGYTHGKRRTYATEDSPRFEGNEVIQATTLARSQAEDNIKALEARYQCDLSVKKIQADKMKAATNNATIERLEVELQMAIIRQQEYASKEAIYKHVTGMRLVARLSENIDPALRSPKKAKTEEELAIEELEESHNAFLRAQARLSKLNKFGQE